MLDLIAIEDNHWLRGDAGETSLPAAPSVHRAEEIALNHLELADGLQHQAGHESMVLAHRLAAAMLFSLISTTSQKWWLAVLIRDIITVGEVALPVSLEALAARLAPVVALPFRTAVGDLIDDDGTAERHFTDLVGLARSIAREVAVMP